MHKLLAFMAFLLLPTFSFAQHSFGAGVGSYSDSFVTATSAILSYTYGAGNTKLEIFAGAGGDEVDYVAGSKLKVGSQNESSFIYVSGGFLAYGLSQGWYESNGSGATLGVGIDFDLSSNFALGLEYSRGFGEDLEEGNIGAIVLRYKF